MKKLSKNSTEEQKVATPLPSADEGPGHDDWNAAIDQAVNVVNGLLERRFLVRLRSGNADHLVAIQAALLQDVVRELAGLKR